MIRPVLRMGDPRLLRIAQPVLDFASPELASLLQDLRDTMAHLDGAGLAAPQIGVDLRVVIFGSDDVNPRYPDASPVPGTVLINPQLEPLSDEVEDGWEGCLSVPGLRGIVPRWHKLRYSGFDEHGRHFERTVDGFHARVVQHECDHLDGILYPMRMTDFSQFGFNEEISASGDGVSPSATAQSASCARPPCSAVVSGVAVVSSAPTDEPTLNEDQR